MSIAIELPPDAERTLAERTKQTGQTVADFAAGLLVKVAALPHDMFSPEGHAEIVARLAALDRLGSYDTRVRAGLPPLSDEAVSRDAIYEGRGL